MTEAERPAWQPTRFVRFERSLKTSVRTAQIVTDAGKAYCKAMGNPEGPHALACEWVGTQLARWLGLPTFDCAILTLDDLDEIPFAGGGQAEPGPAFVARAEPGHTWGGTGLELQLVDNQEAIAKLVVFDTWTLNCDRYPPDLATRQPNYDNVFLSEEGASPGRFRLVAMDHTHCFTCGRELNERIASIDRTKDGQVYGLFPGFVAAVQVQRPVVEAAAERLRTFTGAVGHDIVRTIPTDWQVSEPARAALVDLLTQRAAFVADNIMRVLVPACWPQGELDFDSGGAS